MFAAILVFITVAAMGVVVLLFLRRSSAPKRMPPVPGQHYEFLITEADWYVGDPTVGFTHRPHARRRFDWPEHPNGRIEVVTNGLGLREDRETREQPPPDTERWLVVGDSHIDGIVFNRETFPHQLEAELTRQNPTRAFEVLNAATGMFGPYQYARMLEKLAKLEPRVFIVVLYTGNDFSDALWTAGHLDAVVHPPHYYATLEGAAEIYRPPIDQALNQVYFFKTHPALKSVALARTYEQLELVIDRCQRDDIRLHVVLLPTKVDIEWRDDEDNLVRVTTRLGLTREDLEINRTLAAEVAKWLDRKRVPRLDPTAALTQAGSRAFWRQDYHLSAEGHRLLAVELAKQLAR